MGLTEMGTGEVVTVSQDDDITSALEHMDSEGVGSVVIADGDEPMGIVTDRMIAMYLKDHGDMESVSVSDVMSEDLITIDESASHFEALQMMSENGIRRIPVVENGGSLRGIITLDDLIVVMAAEMSNASDVIEQQAGRV